MKVRVASVVSALPPGTTISEQSRALYLSSYENWERELVGHLDRQPRSPVCDEKEVARDGRIGLCHHNVQEYCRFNGRAKPVLGWLADGRGYILHSVVELEGLLREVTPVRLPISFPFVRDEALLLTWRALDNGKTRAVITREGREMPVSLRTPKAAREFRQFAERQQSNGSQQAVP